MSNNNTAADPINLNPDCLVNRYIDLRIAANEAAPDGGEPLDMEEALFFEDCCNCGSCG